MPSVRGLLNKTCTIIRQSHGKDSVTDETRYSETIAATDVPCAVQVMSAKERSQPVQAGVTEFNVYFVAGTDVRASDRLADVIGYPDAKFQVTSVAADDAGRGAYVRVSALHVQGGGVA